MTLLCRSSCYEVNWGHTALCHTVGVNRGHTERIKPLCPKILCTAQRCQQATHKTLFLHLSIWQPNSCLLFLCGQGQGDNTAQFKAYKCTKAKEHYIWISHWQQESRSQKEEITNILFFLSQIFNSLILVNFQKVFLKPSSSSYLYEFANIDKQKQLGWNTALSQEVPQGQGEKHSRTASVVRSKTEFKQDFPN